MVKSSFQQVYDKSIKFFDFQYHLHKSTFKGLSNLMKQYSNIQKDYSSRLIGLIQDVKSELPDLQTELACVKSSLKDYFQCISTFSQLHFNYSQRLRDISTSLYSEYSTSKKIKQKHMKILKDNFSDNLDKARQSRSRTNIQQQQQKICLTLYNHLDTYLQQQSLRCQHLKQQVLIYFSFTKRIQQKQQQITTKHKQKISEQEAQIKVSGMDQIGEQLVLKYNEISGDKQILKKTYGKIQQGFRDSLRESVIMQNKALHVDNFKSKIKQALEKYVRLPQRIMNFNMLVADKHHINGLFDKTVLKKSHLYSGLFSSQTFVQIAFDMLCSYALCNSSSQTNLLLSTIKGNLKLRGVLEKHKNKTLSQFISHQLQVKNQMELDQTKVKFNKQYIFHFTFLLVLSQLYNLQEDDFRVKGQLDQERIIQYFKVRQFQLNQLTKTNHIHLTVATVLVKYLISSIIVYNQDQPLVLDDFGEYLLLIQKFAQTYFLLSANITKLIFLDHLENTMRQTKSNYIQQLSYITQRSSKLSKCIPCPQQQSLYLNILLSQICLNLASGLIHFFLHPIPLINFFQMLLCVQSISTDNFSAVQYFYQCLRRAGHQYIFWIDKQKRIIQPTIWQGQMRLKNMVEALQKLQYDQIMSNHFEPTANQIARFIHVQQSIVQAKMKEQFLLVLNDIIQNNLNLLLQQQGIDKQGYILKLGIFLSQIQVLSSQSLQKKYFIVLQRYLKFTQTQYTLLLQHSRKTQLWLLEQNSLSTQNCIDFCSLLYKPFQFLLSTLKNLLQHNQNSFAQEFSQFIKNKLNGILKQHIGMYLKFLLDSLRTYNSQEQPINYKISRKQIEKVIKPNTEDRNNMKFLFKEILARIYNLQFLKDQLDQIMKDFLQHHVYQQIGGSIFNIQNLSQAISKYKQNGQILTNIKQIVEMIKVTQQKLIFKISDITVLHFMKRMFINLYFQQQKSTFQQFFSTKNDYKLSLHTFVSFQQQIQQIFVMIRKTLPDYIQEKYYQRLLYKFFRSLRLQILNSNKFKIPRTKEQIIKYLDQDTSFVCTIIKQKFVQPKIVQNQLEKPLKNLLNSIKQGTKQLIQQFEAETLKRNNQECRFIMIILYLRVNDEKAQQFFKKYKTIVFN